MKPENLKMLLDTYGIGVRAGVITPQVEDEKQLREAMGLPPMSSSVLADWNTTDNVRKPITLQKDQTAAPVTAPEAGA